MVSAIATSSTPGRGHLLDDPADPVDRHLAGERAAERHREGDGGDDPGGPGQRARPRRRPRSPARSVIPWLAWENSSVTLDDAVDLVDAGGRRPVEPAGVEHQPDPRRRAPDGRPHAGHDGLAVGHLRDELRVDERGDLRPAQAGRGAARDQLDLLLGAQPGGVVLQPVAGADLDDLDRAHGSGQRVSGLVHRGRHLLAGRVGGSCHGHRARARGRPRRTRRPRWPRPPR